MSWSNRRLLLGAILIIAVLTGFLVTLPGQQEEFCAISGYQPSCATKVSFDMNAGEWAAAVLAVLGCLGWLALELWMRRNPPGKDEDPYYRDSNHW